MRQNSLGVHGDYGDIGVVFSIQTRLLVRLKNFIGEYLEDTGIYVHMENMSENLAIFS
jgi:hypothetical protein